MFRSDVLLAILQILYVSVLFLSFPATERVGGVERKRRVGEVSGGRAGVLRPRRQNQIVQRGAETPQSAGRIALPAAARRPG